VARGGRPHHDGFEANTLLVRLKPDTAEPLVRLKPDTNEPLVRLKPDATAQAAP
jgi:hypothetical protein